MVTLNGGMGMVVVALSVACDGNPNKQDRTQDEMGTMRRENRSGRGKKREQKRAVDGVQ